MRVLTIINGRRTVTEILEFEPLDETTIRLNAAGNLMDIKITGVDISTADSIANQLLTYGYVDLSRYHAECDKDPDDDEPEYEAECAACGKTFRYDTDTYETGEITCPHCGENLELNTTQEPEGEERPTYLVKCNCGVETRFDAEVLKSGQAYCPSCFRKCSAAEVEEEPNSKPDSTVKTNQQSKRKPLSNLFFGRVKNGDPWEQ